MTWATTAKATEKQRNCRAVQAHMQRSRHGVHTSTIAVHTALAHPLVFEVHTRWSLKSTGRTVAKMET